MIQETISKFQPFGSCDLHIIRTQGQLPGATYRQPATTLSATFLVQMTDRLPQTGSIRSGSLYTGNVIVWTGHKTLPFNGKGMKGTDISRFLISLAVYMLELFSTFRGSLALSHTSTLRIITVFTEAPPYTTRSQVNSLHILTFCISNVHFNNILHVYINRILYKLRNALLISSQLDTERGSTVISLPCVREVLDSNPCLGIGCPATTVYFLSSFIHNHLLASFMTSVVIQCR
jgi:hypothetical protein